MRSIRTVSVAFIVPALLNAAATTITLSSSANPAVFGHLIGLTAVVAPGSATGTVTFYDGVSVLETEPLVNGTAVFATTLLASGSRSLKAYYGGDSSNAASTSAVLMQTVKTVAGNGFHQAENFPAGGGEFMAVADFNGDGKPDLAVSNTNYDLPAGLISILLGNGDGTFQPAVTYSAGALPSVIVTGDFNGDGKADFAVACQNAAGIGGGEVDVFLGNGDGTFQAPLPYTALGSVYQLVVGDFNGDGKADLATLGGGNPAPFSIALGNGDGTFGVSVSYSTTSAEAYLIAAGDFNGDGNADLAIALNSNFPTNGTLEIYLGNGDGTFQPLSATFVTPVSPIGIAIGDVNGDGKADVVLTEAYSNTGYPTVSSVSVPWEQQRHAAAGGELQPQRVSRRGCDQRF